MLRNEQFNITLLIHRLNELFLLQRGDLCIYLYDSLNGYLTQDVPLVDEVKVQSLFQQALINVFRDGSASSQQFIEAVTVTVVEGAGRSGWSSVDVGLVTSYPVNILLVPSAVMKYKKLFSELLLLNVGLAAVCEA